MSPVEAMTWDPLAVMADRATVHATARAPMSCDIVTSRSTKIGTRASLIGTCANTPVGPRAVCAQQAQRKLACQAPVVLILRRENQMATAK